MSNFSFRSSMPLLFLFLHLITPLILLTAAAADASYTPLDNFLQCFHQLSALSNTTAAAAAARVIYYPDTPSYGDLFLSSINNPRFLAPSTPKPILIVGATDECHVQASVLCCKTHGLQMRVRSGGHDYEGLSYRSDGEPFLLVDLNKLRSIRVDVEHATAWVQAGATVGELYYNIAMESGGTMGFPAGLCPTVGLGGHFSAGGFGPMVRKYGLAIDHILDARLVDSNGLILNKDSMGEDLFWAIRGGGGASFGVILSYEIQLVPVPPRVTVFTVGRILSGQAATALVTKWQQAAHETDRNLFIRALISAVNDPNNGGERMIQLSFNSLFLGERQELLRLMGRGFPDLGLEAQDCIEMSWIESVLYIAGYKGRPLEVLLDRKPQFNSSFKAKSDFLREPIPGTGWEGIWRWFLVEGVVERAIMIVDPYGGRMNEIAESDTPFPHRNGTLYNIQYVVRWVEEGEEASKKHIHWLRSFYGYMTPYVSRNPRAAYLGYLDLDLGRNQETTGSNISRKASVWGRRYFKDNFYRLSYIKGKVDPINFFRNQQTIPALASYCNTLKC